MNKLNSKDIICILYLTFMTHLLNVARNIFTLNDVLDGTDKAEDSSKCTNNYCLYTQYPHNDVH